jgi:hypothetical protein
MKVFGEIVKEPISSMCFCYPYHRVLADLTPGVLVSVRSLSTRLLLCNAISFFCFICLRAFACNIFGLKCGLELFHQDNLYLFVDMRTCRGKCEVGAHKNLV